MSDGVAGIGWIDIYLDGDHWSALPPPAWVNIIPRLGNMILSFNFVLIFKRNGWITRISADNISCTIQTVLRDILMLECCPLVPGTRRIIARWGGGCRYGDPADTRPESCDQQPATSSSVNTQLYWTPHCPWHWLPLLLLSVLPLEKGFRLKVSRPLCCKLPWKNCN